MAGEAVYNNAKGRTTSVTRTARAGDRETVPLVSLEVEALCAVLDGGAAVPEVLAEEGPATAAPVGVAAALSLVAPAAVAVASPASAATSVMVASPAFPG